MNEKYYRVSKMDTRSSSKLSAFNSKFWTWITTYRKREKVIVWFIDYKYLALAREVYQVHRKIKFKNESFCTPFLVSFFISLIYLLATNCIYYAADCKQWKYHSVI